MMREREDKDVEIKSLFFSIFTLIIALRCLCGLYASAVNGLFKYPSRTQSEREIRDPASYLYRIA